jgi:hypothetical protein
MGQRDDLGAGVVDGRHDTDVPAVPAEDRVVVDVLDDVQLLDRRGLVLAGPPAAAARQAA